METDKESIIRKCDQSRALIVRVYHYLKAEYEFTVSQQKCKCDLSHMRDVTQRTAEAVGVDVASVRHMLNTETVVPNYNFNFFVRKSKKKKNQNCDDVNEKKTEAEYTVEPVVTLDYDDFIEVDFGEPDIKKVKTEPEMNDSIKQNQNGQNNYLDKFVDFVNFDANVKQEVDVKEENESVDVKEENESEDDDGEEGHVIYESITVKDECIM